MIQKPLHRESLFSKAAWNEKTWTFYPSSWWCFKTIIFLNNNIDASMCLRFARPPIQEVRFLLMMFLNPSVEMHKGDCYACSCMLTLWPADKHVKNIWTQPVWHNENQSLFSILELMVENYKCSKDLLRSPAYLEIDLLVHGATTAITKCHSVTGIRWLTLSLNVSSHSFARVGEFPWNRTGFLVVTWLTDANIINRGILNRTNTINIMSSPQQE